MFKKLLIAVLVPFALFGCGSDVVVPEQYVGKDVSYHIRDYDDFEKKGLKTLRIHATVSVELTPEQRIATVLELARFAQHGSNAKVVHAFLYNKNMPKSSYMARADLYVDKCGFNGDNCNGIQWDITYSKNSASALEKEIYQYWWDNRDNFQKNGMTDDEALKAEIAKELNITPKQVSLFFYDSTNYEKH